MRDQVVWWAVVPAVLSSEAPSGVGGGGGGLRLRPPGVPLYEAPPASVTALLRGTSGV